MAIPIQPARLHNSLVVEVIPRAIKLLPTREHKPLVREQEPIAIELNPPGKRQAVLTGHDNAVGRLHALAQNRTGRARVKRSAVAIHDPPVRRHGSRSIVKIVFAAIELNQTRLHGVRFLVKVIPATAIGQPAALQHARI